MRCGHVKKGFSRWRCKPTLCETDPACSQAEGTSSQHQVFGCQRAVFDAPWSSATAEITMSTGAL